jgi:hypothetical protein
MNEVDHHSKPYHADLGFRIVARTGSSIYSICAIFILTAIWIPSVHADVKARTYFDPTERVCAEDISTGSSVKAVRNKARYHSGVTNLEFEQAVIHASQQYRVQPALLLAVIKAGSSFNPTVISKAGAVGLMRLVPETAIRHGVRNLYDANENITGGGKHLRYLLDRFHGNTRLALAAYNAGERKVDRYGQIPPYKETQDYVKKVLVYYRGYKKDGWLMPAILAAPSMPVGKPY